MNLTHWRKCGQVRSTLGYGCNIAVFIALFLAGCNRTADRGAYGTPSASSGIRYATGFKVTNIGEAKLVEVTYPFQGASSGYLYLLVPRGGKPPEHSAEARVIYTPLESIVCTSTTHIPLLDYLGETDKLIGFPAPRYISSEKMRRRIDDGKVTDLGIDKGLNLEKLAVLDPGIVMGYTMSSDYGQFKKIEALGIPVVINGEYLERHPLGRAEWIKFMGLFFNREKEADSVFDAIEKNYLETKNKVNNVTDRPTVVSGIVYGDAWFLPGGQNYAARLLKDAGCRYLFEDTNSNGYLELSFESVYEKAHDADLWIGTGTYKGLGDITSADIRYTRFEAFQAGEVYNYDARIGSGGGNEFLELGYLRPDIILKDLVKIGHPALLPGHTLFFHRKLPAVRESKADQPSG
jgi:iron complex transport system substrate-binding protein